MVALDIFTARLSTFHVPSPPGNRAQHTKQGKARQIQTRRERENRLKGCSSSSSKNWWSCIRSQVLVITGIFVEYKLQRENKDPADGFSFSHSSHRELSITPVFFSSSLSIALYDCCLWTRCPWWQWTWISEMRWKMCISYPMVNVSGSVIVISPKCICQH